MTEKLQITLNKLTFSFNSYFSDSLYNLQLMSAGCQIFMMCHPQLNEGKLLMIMFNLLSQYLDLDVLIDFFDFVF